MARPISCKQVFQEMPNRLDKEASKGLNAIYQFDLSDEGGGKWYVTISDQQCRVEEGSHPSPNITLSMSAQDYLDLVAGNLDGQAAFMTGRLRISGDIGLALRMESLFRV